MRTPASSATQTPPYILCYFALFIKSYICGWVLNPCTSKVWIITLILIFVYLSVLYMHTFHFLIFINFIQFYFIFFISFFFLLVHVTFRCFLYLTQTIKICLLFINLCIYVELALKLCIKWQNSIIKVVNKFTQIAKKWQSINNQSQK